LLKSGLEDNGGERMAKSKEKPEEKGIILKIFEAYRGLGQNVWYVLFLAMVVIPMVYPLALPIGITKYTRDFKTALDSAQDGGIMWISVDYCTGGEGPGLPAAVDVIKYAVTKKQMKIVNIGFLMPVVSQLAENVFAKVPWDSYGYVYGEDYVNCGYYLGGEATVAALGRDFQSVITKDYHGTPASQIPLLQQIQDINDIALIYVLSDYMFTEINVARQWPTTPERPYIAATFASYILPYYPGSCAGFLDVASSGAAEFEVLSGIPGNAVIGSDILSMGQLFLLIVVLMANISYWIVRSLGGKT
jgi:hypothetical protein